MTLMRSISDELIGSEAKESKPFDSAEGPRFPDLLIADLKFLCSSAKGLEREALTGELKKLLKDNGMVEIYEECCNDIEGWARDDNLISEWKSINEHEISILDQKITSAQDSLSEIDVNRQRQGEETASVKNEAILYTPCLVVCLRDLHFQKISFLCRTGAFTEAEKAMEVCESKVASMTLSKKLDLVIYRIRIELFRMTNRTRIIELIDRAKKMLDDGGSGDWDQKTRLKIYEAISLFAVQRDFEASIKLFLETVSTYTCYEVIPFNRFVVYTVLLAMIALKRPDLKKKVLMNSEVKQVLYSNSYLAGFLESLYDCDYARFFKHLTLVERALERDRYWNAHYRYYVRELKIKAYEQHLTSYSSIGLRAFAEAFGVSEEFIDRELSSLISNGRLNCKINRVDALVNMTRPHLKNKDYVELIKKGDVLLNRLQKLSRVINL